MPAKTVGNWDRRAWTGPRPTNGGRGSGVTDVPAELSQLRAENAQLKLDKETLKLRRGKAFLFSYYRTARWITAVCYNLYFEGGLAMNRLNLQLSTARP